MIKRLICFTFIVLALSSCAVSRSTLGLEPATPAVKGANVIPVFVSTTRARTDDLAAPFSSDRSQTLSLARFDIAVPPAHVPGQVEVSTTRPNPQKDFSARSYMTIADRKAFIADINKALASRAPDDQEIVIFVHGYNNNFADGIFRNTQIINDYGIKSVSLHYSWPSAGSLPLYIYDRDSSLMARDGLADTLEIASQTRAKRIILLGHSMGGYVVMEALRTLALTGRRNVIDHLTAVFLAAPDIDTDLFTSQVHDIGRLPKQFVIAVSRNDKALDVSQRIAGGHPRVGNGADVASLQEKNITVLDLSDLDGGDHNAFASSPTLIQLSQNNKLMRNLVRQKDAAAQQAALADGSAVIQGAALVVFLPVRLLGGALQSAAGR